MTEHLILNLIENAALNTGTIKFLDRKGNYTSYDYKEIYDQAKCYASYLIENGVKKNDVISIMLPTGIEFFSSFFGILLIGAVPTCLYPPMSLTDINEWVDKATNMMESASSNFIICNLQISTFFGNKLETLKKKTLLIENFSKVNSLFKLDIESYKSSDLCFLQFSSGTTGDPKPVMITNKNAITNSKILAEGCQLESHKVLSTVSWAPLYHDMGLVGAFIATCVANGNLTLIKPDDFLRKPKLWLKAIGDQKALITAAPNFAFGLCTKRISESELSQFDLSSLKIAICGAEVIYEKTITEFYEKFKICNLSKKAITPSFGIAEGTLGVTMASRKKEIQFTSFDALELARGIAIKNKNGISLCSLGIPLRGVGLSIKDDEHNLLDEGKVGKIFISGDSVTQGYYNDHLKTSEILINNELYTGDEGFIYKGELYLCGRIKDTIIIRGKNYYPTVFEEKLNSIKELREGRIAVSSIYDDNENTEQLIVLAEVKEEVLLEQKDEIAKSIHQSLQAMGQKAFVIELYAPRTLPKTTSGKLRRRAAVDAWKSNSLQKSQDHSSIDVFKIQLKILLRKVSNKISILKENSYAYYS